MISIGNFLSIVGCGGLIVYSRYRDVAGFAQLQRGIDAVKWVEPVSDEEYEAFRKELLRPSGREGKCAIRSIIARAGIGPDLVTSTHIDMDLLAAGTVHSWRGPRLPEHAWRFASSVAKLADGPFVLVHPFSINSSPPEEYWPYWEEAMALLVNECPYPVVVTGSGWTMKGQHRRVIDLVGSAPDMTCVFALAHMSTAVVTVCNSLAHYCRIGNIPAVITGNERIAEKHDFFARWLTADWLEIVHVDDDFDVFEQAFWRLI